MSGRRVIEALWGSLSGWNGHSPEKIGQRNQGVFLDYVKCLSLE